MREIYLANGKGVALVDDEDYERIAKLKWRRTRIYAAAGANPVYMHRLVLNLGKSIDKTIVVDYINGNGLDNRKVNLRVTSQRDNILPSHPNCTGYSGVLRHGPRRRSAKYCQKYLGMFPSLKSAALAVDKAVRASGNGESALLNFPK